jgi:predicted nuclease of predicted toxin-antitoxin system
VPSLLQFHLDESVDHAIARGLSQRGVDVTTSTDEALVGATDDTQFEHVIRAGRVLVTHDHDFLKLAASLWTIAAWPIARLVIEASARLCFG